MAIKVNVSCNIILHLMLNNLNSAPNSNYIYSLANTLRSVNELMIAWWLTKSHADVLYIAVYCLQETLHDLNWCPLTPCVVARTPMALVMSLPVAESDHLVQSSNITTINRCVVWNIEERNHTLLTLLYSYLAMIVPRDFKNKWKQKILYMY